MSAQKNLLLGILEDLRDLQQMNQETLETYIANVNAEYDIIRKHLSLNNPS